MSLVRGPFAKYQCGGCGRWIDRSISARNAEQELSDLRDGPQLFCAVCPAPTRLASKEPCGFPRGAEAWGVIRK